MIKSRILYDLIREGIRRNRDWWAWGSSGEGGGEERVILLESFCNS